MIKLTTLDKDGKIFKEEVKPKRFRPLNGWERLKNGDFVKKLDDPRCISFQEMKKYIQDSHKDEIKKSINKPITSKAMQAKFTDVQLLGKIRAKRTAYGRNVTTMYHASIKEAGIAFALNIKDYFAKIEINTLQNIIRFWKRNKEEPDIILEDYLIVNE